MGVLRILDHGKNMTKGSHSSHGTYRGSYSSHGTHRGSGSSHGTWWAAMSTFVLHASAKVSLAIMSVGGQMPVIRYSFCRILGIMYVIPMESIGSYVSPWQPSRFSFFPWDISEVTFFLWDTSWVTFFPWSHLGSYSSHDSEFYLHTKVMNIDFNGFKFKNRYRK